MAEKKFKRIATSPEAVAEGTDVTDMLYLSDTTLAKLQTKQTQLSAEFGFEPTIDQTVAYLLREVSASPADIIIGAGPDRRMLMLPPGMDAAAKAEMDRDARSCLQHGQKIQAIKYVRARTEWGLRDAKDYVESLQGVTF